MKCTVSVDGRLHRAADIFDDFDPRPIHLVLVVVSDAGDIVGGDGRIVDDDGPDAAWSYDRHDVEGVAELVGTVLERERMRRGVAHLPVRCAGTCGALDEVSQRPKVPDAIGHDDAGATDAEHSTEFAGGFDAIFHVVEHVRCEHRVEDGGLEREPGHVGVDDLVMTGCAEHPDGEVTADAGDAPTPQFSQVHAVAAPHIENPVPWPDVGEIEHPRREVDRPFLELPEPLASAQVPVVDVLRYRVQHHRASMAEVVDIASGCPDKILPMSDYVDVDGEILERVSTRCLALPEARDEPAWTGHRFLVRKKNFAHVFAICAADGSVATMLSVRSPDEERLTLLAIGHPFFHLGWGRNAVGMVLEDDTDWDEVTEIVTESYCVLAPQKLVALVARPDPID